MDIWQSSFWKNPWVITIGGGAIAGIIPWTAVQGIGPPAPRPSPTTTASATPATANQGASASPVSTPVWSGGISISENGGGGLDFDSVPPVSGTNNLTFNGFVLYAGSPMQIATWPNSSKPTRGQCNTWAQTHPSNQQPANAGAGYCLLTGQGHTVYLKITSITAPQGNGTVNAHAIVWNTTD